VTIQTKLISGLAKLRVIFRAVHVVAREAGNPVLVHYALHEVIALHAVLVRGAIRKVREGELAEGVFFELPEVAEIEPDMIADGPIVIFPFDRIG